jgi:hypothetical protein
MPAHRLRPTLDPRTDRISDRAADGGSAMYPDPELVGIIAWEREREADQHVTGASSGLGPQVLSELRTAPGALPRGRHRLSLLKAGKGPIVLLIKAMANHDG